MNLVAKIRSGEWSNTGKILLIGLAALIILPAAIYLIWCNGRFVPGLTFAGQPLGGRRIAEGKAVIRQFAEEVQTRKVVLNYKGRTLNVRIGTIGINIDVPATVKRGYQIGRTDSWPRRIMVRWQASRRGKELQPVFHNNRESLDAFYRLLEAGIAIEPVRSVVTLGANGAVSYTPSRVGRMIDRNELTALLEGAAVNPKIQKIDIPVKKMVPYLTESDIEKWGLGRVLGLYSTKFTATQADRTHNLSLASGIINNVLIYPGQNFSFNTWVGPRVSESGYKEAPVVLLGKLVPGIGGGVCQVSSTLYNAVLLANLKVVNRVNHSLPSSYVPLARDATVVYDDIDFVFENSNATPVLIATRFAPPNLTIAVLGKKTGWESVVLESNLLETYPFKNKDIPDPTLPKGERVKAAPGVNGFKVELWRKVVMKDGTVKKRRENVSIYPAQPEEYKVGTRVQGETDGRVEDTATTRGAP